MIRLSAFARDAVFATVATGLQGASRFVINLGVGRLAGVHALGNMMAGFSLAQIFAIIGPSPAGTAAAKFGSAERARSGGDYEGASAHVAKRVCQILPLLTLLSVLVCWIAYDVQFAESCVVGVALIGVSLWSVGRGSLYGRGSVRKSSILDMLTSVISVVATLIAAGAGVSGMYLLLPGAVAQLVYIPSLLKGIIRTSTPQKVAQEIDRFIFYAIVGMLSSAGFLHFTVVLVRAAFGAEQSGQFNAAVAISLPLVMVSSSFTLVFYPRLSRWWAEGDIATYRHMTDRYARAIAAYSFAAIGCLMVFSREVTDFVWGAEYAQAQLIIPFMLGAVFLKASTAVVVASLTAGPNWGMRTSARTSALGAGAGLAVSAALLPLYGSIGAALGYFVGSSIISLAPLGIVWRRGRYRWKSAVLRYSVGSLLIVSIWFIIPSTGALFGGLILLAVVCCVILPELKDMQTILRRQWSLGPVREQ